MNRKTRKYNKQKRLKNGDILDHECENIIPQHPVKKQETKVPIVPQNDNGKQECFEFKVPAIPQSVKKNIIPTGKQIPRTPMKPIINPREERVIHPELCYVPSSKRDDCHIIDAKVKNIIPKGKEIPRTPTPCYKLLNPSSTCYSQLLPEENLGVLPLSDVGEDYVKFQESILSGKINMRRNTLITRTKVEGNESKEGNSENSSCSLSLNLKSSDEVLACQNSSEDLSKEVETNCVITERSPHIDYKQKGRVRRNPERMARRKVDYKL